MKRSDVYFDGELRPGVRSPIKNPLFFGQKELVKRGEGSERELVERLLGSKLDAVRREYRCPTSESIGRAGESRQAERP